MKSCSRAWDISFVKVGPGNCTVDCTNKNALRSVIRRLSSVDYTFEISNLDLVQDLADMIDFVAYSKQELFLF